MNIPPYWVRERRLICGMQVRLRGISAHSQQDAEARLAERARLWQEFLALPASQADALRFREALRQLDGSPEPYSAAILEPVEQQPDAQNIITRNRYGCLVLNSVSLCFADVDRFRAGFWASLFGNKKKEEAALVAFLRRLCAADESLSARLYRTAHGWRVILRGAGLTVGSVREDRLFEALQCDPLYRKLCRSQLCWRARLSPKPFYRGLKRYRQPANAQLRAQEWVEAYEKATAGVAVCRLLETFGPALHDPMVELHDAATLALKPDLELG